MNCPNCLSEDIVKNGSIHTGMQKYNYATILDKNRLYLVGNGKLQELIICFEDLKLCSIDLIFALNRHDLAKKNNQLKY